MRFVNKAFHNQSNVRRHEHLYTGDVCTYVVCV